MGHRTLFVIATSTLLMLGVLLWAPVVGAQTAPAIDVSVNGNTIADGERIVVPSGNLSVAVTGNVDLESVIVRIDGEDEVAVSPNGSTFRTSLTDPFTARSNSVQVIVKDETGTLTTHESTVYLDTISPKIELTSPFEIAAGHRFPTSQTLTNASVTIAGTVHDASNLTEFSVRVIGNGQGIERTEHTDGDFSFDTTLVPGNNSLVVSATDEYGHRSYRSTEIKVTDEAEPVLSFRNWPNETESATITPTVIATDDGGVRTLSYRIPGQPERTLVEPTSKLLDAGRTNVTRNPELEFYRPGTYNVTFNVTDYANRWSEVTKTVHYDPVTPAERVAPTVTVDQNRTGLINESRYRLTANVTNGSIAKVAIESEHQFGGITHFETLYDGQNRSRYTIARNVSIQSGYNEIQIRVTDALGTVHEKRIEVETANATAYAPPTTAAPTTNVNQTTEALTTAQDTTPVQTTVGPTRISVTQNTPMSPRTETSSPLSPLVTIVAFGLIVLLLTRRK